MGRRLVHIDVLKIMAIVLVMMCHIPALYSVEATQQDMSIVWLVTMIVGTMGVPLFMMCTGALVLKKKMDNLGDVFIFYRKNLLSIYVTGALWCLFYYFISIIKGTESFTASGLLKTILLINKPEVHLWYIRMILMYYAIIPLIIYLLKKHNTLYYLIVLLVTLLTFGKNGYEILMNHNSCPTTSGLSLCCYLLYLTIGYYATNVGQDCWIKPYFTNKTLIISLCLLMFVGGIGFAVWLRAIDWYRFMWYDNPFVLIASVGMFMLLVYGGKILLNTDNLRIKCKWITELSKMTFGVYLCHMIIMFLVYGLMVNVYCETPMVVEWMLVLITTLVLSFCMVYISHFIPKLSKILFRY